MTTLAQLELAIAHLERALEDATFFHHSATIVDHLSVLTRAAVKVKHEIEDARRETYA